MWICLCVCQSDSKTNIWISQLATPKEEVIFSRLLPVRNVFALLEKKRVAEIVFFYSASQINGKKGYLMWASLGRRRMSWNWVKYVRYSKWRYLVDGMRQRCKYHPQLTQHSSADRIRFYGQADTPYECGGETAKETLFSPLPFEKLTVKYSFTLQSYVRRTCLLDGRL